MICNWNISKSRLACNTSNSLSLWSKSNHDYWNSVTLILNCENSCSVFARPFPALFCGEYAWFLSIAIPVSFSTSSSVWQWSRYIIIYIGLVKQRLQRNSRPNNKCITIKHYYTYTWIAIVFCPSSTCSKIRHDYSVKNHHHAYYCMCSYLEWDLLLLRWPTTHWQWSRDW